MMGLKIEAGGAEEGVFRFVKASIHRLA